jgi:ABC-type branched-subunit amino acid transport system substrate-binding protein
MARDSSRRDFLRLAGGGALVGVAGCIGSPDNTATEATEAGTATPTETSTDGGGGESTTTTEGDGGGSMDGPDALIVIGYPQDGIQLFRDLYSQTGDDLDVLVPDGLRDGAMPAQVGNDMSNVIGTAPAAGGPNQEAFASQFEEAYDAAPGVFTSQSYDSVALQILANALAGENSGTAVRDQMRRAANPEGMTVGPQNFLEGVEAAMNGEDVNYQGASSATNFNEAGDPASAAYAIWEFEGQDSQSTSTMEVQNFEGENPAGAGSVADSAPGSDAGREISLGILLPSTGSLASVGEPMIDAAQLPVRMVNDSDLDLSVNAQVEDTQTNPSSGVTAAQSMASAGVPSVCGSASSGVNVPVSQEVFIPNQMVGCSPSSTALSVTNLEDDDYVFRTAPSDILQGRVMAQVASERLGASTVATLYVNNDYGQQLSERFTEVFENSFDGQVTGQTAFNQGESSYSSVIETGLSGSS